jgi:Tol biopolymer transport system component
VAIDRIYLRRPTPDLDAMRWSLSAPEGVSAGASANTVSPDGRLLAFVGLPTTGSRAHLWVRRLDTADAVPLPGTEGARGLFWSPDSRFIGFFAEGKLKKIAASGGRPEIVCDTPEGFSASGTWNRDGVIVFSVGTGKGLYRVASTGGAPTPATTLDRSRGELMHQSPYFISDGRHFLYEALLQGSGSLSGRSPGIYVASLDSQESKRVVGGESPVYVRPGYLIFQREGTLLAQRFDVDRFEISGGPTLIDKAGQNATVSDTGVLIFDAGTPMGSRDGQLFWTDRAGNQLAPVGRPGDYQNLRLSPDGKRLAVGRISNANNDIWILDLSRGTESRFTFEPTLEDFPVWSPDGRRIVFAASPVRGSGSFNLYVKPSSGAGKEELLLESTGFTIPTDWSPDGRFILYQSGISDRGDLWALPLFGDRKPIEVARTESVETGGQFSPDGRWIAYVSDREVYVQAFPPSGAKWQISNTGGRDPRWRKDGKELFYLASGELMAVPVKTDPTFEGGAAKVLFATVLSGRFAVHYATTNEGQRFLLPYLKRGAPHPPTVVVNWTSLLDR